MLSPSDAAELSKALAKAHLSDDLDCGNAFRIAYEAGVSSAIFQISMVVGELSDGKVDGVAFYTALTDDHTLAPLVTVVQDQSKRGSNPDGSTSMADVARITAEVRNNKSGDTQ